MNKKNFVKMMCEIVIKLAAKAWGETTRTEFMYSTMWTVKREGRSPYAYFRKNVEKEVDYYKTDSLLFHPIKRAQRDNIIKCLSEYINQLNIMEETKLRNRDRDMYFADWYHSIYKKEARKVLDLDDKIVYGPGYYELMKRIETSCDEAKIYF